jgi:hypothetical protein
MMQVLHSPDRVLEVVARLVTPTRDPPIPHVQVQRSMHRMNITPPITRDDRLQERHVRRVVHTQKVRSLTGHP